MKTDVVAKDCWIVGQLAGIRMLERQLTDAFKSPAHERTTVFGDELTVELVGESG